MRFAVLSIIILLFFGCAHSDQMPDVRINKIDSNSITLSGLDKNIIADIGRDTTAGVWQALLPVYKMPADTDMKDFQNPQPGKYAVKDTLVIFAPDTAFKKGQTYFVRYFDYQGAKSAWQILSEKKRLGAAKYRDLVFSY